MIEYYLSLLNQSERIEVFEKAIAEAVRPDDVVVDLGCGVGTFAIFAARAGACRVFGVENSPVIEFARQLVRDNGAEVELISGDAHDIRLPEPATLLIFEDFVADLLSDDTRSLYNSVTTNWMADKFRVLPERVTLYAGPICSPTVRQEIDPWQSGRADKYGLDLSSLLQVNYNNAHHVYLNETTEFLAAPTLLLDQKLDTPMPERWSDTIIFDITREGELEGLLLWHDLVLNPSTIYSNRPRRTASQGWGQTLLPLPEPWPTRVGDRLECRLDYQPGADDGLWKWSFRLGAEGRSEQKQHSANTFAGLPLSKDRLKQFQLDRVVSLTPQSELEAYVLSLVDGRRTLGEIVDEVQRQKPGVSSPLAEVIKYLDGHRAS